MPLCLLNKRHSFVESSIIFAVILETLLILVPLLRGKLDWDMTSYFTYFSR